MSTRRDGLLIANLHHAAAAARRVRRGLPLPTVCDERSFTEFMEALVRLDRGGHGDAAVLADLVQEAILAIAEAAEHFDGSDVDFGGIAYTAARWAVTRAAYDLSSPVSVTAHARRKNVRPSRVPLDTVGADALNTYMPTGEEQEAHRESEVMRDTLDDLIATPGLLTEKQRSAMRLFLDGTPQREIASQLGLSAHATVKEHISRGIERLRQAAHCDDAETADAA